MGNIVFNNNGLSFESSKPSNLLRIYYPSKIYGNLAYSGLVGFNLGTNYNTSYPGYGQVYLRDNIALDNVNNDINPVSNIYDSDYNFFSNAGNLASMQGFGRDLHSLTGNPGVVNKNVVVNINFGVGWTLQQKLDYIRNQVNSFFSLAPESQLINNGIIVSGYHCPTAGANPSGCREWYGNAPDIGVYEHS